MGSIGPDDTVAPASTPTSGPVAETQAALDALKAGGRGPVSQPAPAPAAPDVPVDDYPLDDEPFDDGAPFPDPGPGGAPARNPQTQTAPAPAPAQAPAQAQAPAPAQAPAAPAQQAAPQVRRPPVPGRYGEAVVREILGAQFIEETSLSEGI
ncbi:hypothetical protein [Curtobacterium sp. 9128]|uniref:hypothetical protein n=1 Tax=Curtobacterium sp. 9128 TaxID=1793722 RepID=UPI002482067C|nr:hypothetical protein [Curtobacterium sp. 9128]